MLAFRIEDYTVALFHYKSSKQIDTLLPISENAMHSSLVINLTLTAKSIDMKKYIFQTV